MKTTALLKKLLVSLAFLSTGAWAQAVTPPSTDWSENAPFTGPPSYPSWYSYSIEQAEVAPDVRNAHTNGWLGQDVSLLNSVVNYNPSHSNNGFYVSSLIRGMVPEAYLLFNERIAFAEAPSVSVTGARSSQLRAIRNQQVSTIPVFHVNALTESSNVTINSATMDSSSNITNGSQSASFHRIHNVDATPINNDQGLKAAYIGGSAALVLSKFPNLLMDEVVRNMDLSRMSDGSFSLSRSLAPKGNLR